MTEDGVTDDLVDNNGVVAKGEVNEEPTDGEFPGVGGNDGNGSDDETTEGEDGSGNDDGSCSDGRGSEEDDEAPRENLSSKTLSVSLSKLTTTKSLNQSLRMLSFHLLLFFLILSTYFLTLFLNFRGSQCKPVIEKNFVSTSCSRSFSWNLDNSPLVLGRSCNKSPALMKILMSSMFEVVNTQINRIQILLLKIISVKDLLRIYNLIQIFELGG